MPKNKETRRAAQFADQQHDGRNETATNDSMCSKLHVDSTMPPIIIYTETVNVGIGQQARLFDVPQTTPQANALRAKLGAEDMNAARALRETYPKLYGMFSCKLHETCRTRSRAPLCAIAWASTEYQAQTGVLVEWNNDIMPALVRLHLEDHPEDRPHIETRGARCDSAGEVA